MVSGLYAGEQALIERLRDLGGVALSIASERAELTWSFGGPRVSEERGHNDRTGEHGPTGRFTGSVSVSIVLRRLGQLPELADTLLSSERLDVEHLEWLVDAENRAWRDVRADAITSALAKADDYAATLGGVVQRVEHVADAGLLTGIGDDGRRLRTDASQQAFTASATSRGGEWGTPVLDPVPQQIRAVIDARVIADVPVRPHAN